MRSDSETLALLRVAVLLTADGAHVEWVRDSDGKLAGLRLTLPVPDTDE